MIPRGEAEAEIHRLLAGYALLLDSGDVAACADLFTGDCEFAISDGRAYQGRERLARFLQKGLDHGMAGIHLPGPTRIDVADDGQTATAWSSFVFVANGSDAIVRGMYRDLLVHDEGRWWLQRRHVEIFPGGPG